jgi:hypothetical protein
MKANDGCSKNAHVTNIVSSIVSTLHETVRILMTDLVFYSFQNTSCDHQLALFPFYQHFLVKRVTVCVTAMIVTVEHSTM